MMELDPLIIGTPVFYKKKITGKTWSISELHAKRVYRQHCADVLRNCDRDKILILDQIGDDNGKNWEKICGFMGMNVPNEKWPHENKNASYASETFVSSGALIQIKLDAELKSRIVKFGIFSVVLPVLVHQFLK